jgi:hypothetical protein
MPTAPISDSRAGRIEALEHHEGGAATVVENLAASCEDHEMTRPARFHGCFVGAIVGSEANERHARGERHHHASQRGGASSYR